MGIALQCMSWELPSPLTEVLVPASSSPWEQGKLCYWPYMAGALLLWRMGDKGDSRGGHCALLLLMPLLMVLPEVPADLTAVLILVIFLVTFLAISLVAEVHVADEQIMDQCKALIFAKEFALHLKKLYLAVKKN